MDYRNDPVVRAARRSILTLTGRPGSAPLHGDAHIMGQRKFSISFSSNGLRVLEGVSFTTKARPPSEKVTSWAFTRPPRGGSPLDPSGGTVPKALPHLHRAQPVDLRRHGQKCRSVGRGGRPGCAHRHGWPIWRNAAVWPAKVRGEPFPPSIELEVEQREARRRPSPPGKNACVMASARSKPARTASLILRYLRYGRDARPKAERSCRSAASDRFR